MPLNSWARRRQEGAPPSGTSRDPVRRVAAHFALSRFSVNAVRVPLRSSSPPQAPETTTSARSSDRSVGKYSWAQSAATFTVGKSLTTSLAFSVRAARASCRLRQLRCWVAPGRDSSSSASSVRRVPSLRSSVRLRRGYTWALFLQTSAGVNPAGSLPGAQDAAVPAAGADSVGTSPPQTAPERCTKASPRANYPDSNSEPSRLRPGRPSALPHRRSLPRLQGA